MNLSELVTLLDKSSAFDLYRLNLMVSDMMEDPKRLIDIKVQLRLGQRVEFFDARNNTVHEVIVEQIKQTRAAVRNIEDGCRWDVSLCAINIQGSDTFVSHANAPGLTRADIRPGDRVGFVDQSGNEQSGTVIRLNPKTVTIEGENIRWRVSYPLLYQVIEPEDI